MERGYWSLAASLNTRFPQEGTIVLFVPGALLLSAAVVVLWFCMPKNGKPVVSAKVAPYIAVAVTMSLVVGVGAMFLGLVELVSNA